MAKINLTCPYCGSDKVLADAYAAWDVETQEWVLHSTYDDKRCDACGGEFNSADEAEVEDHA